MKTTILFDSSFTIYRSSSSKESSIERSAFFQIGKLIEHDDWFFIPRKLQNRKKNQSRPWQHYISIVAIFQGCERSYSLILRWLPSTRVPIVNRLTHKTTMHPMDSRVRCPHQRPVHLQARCPAHLMW